MTIITKYVVEHKGVEKLVTTDKKEADKYDKMLDVADNLGDYLQAMGVKLDNGQMEDLTILLAKNKDDIGKLLKGSAAQNVLSSSKAEIVELDKKQA